MGSLNKFLRFRKRSGFTQKEFGKKLGIVQGYLSDIENGRKVPSKTLDILFAFTVRASKGKSQTQQGSENLTEVNGGPGKASDQLTELVKTKFVATAETGTEDHKEEEEVYRLKFEESQRRIIELLEENSRLKDAASKKETRAIMKLG